MALSESLSARQVFRRVPTTDVCYLIPWNLRAMRALIAQQKITAKDINSNSPQAHQFIRDLLVMAATEVMKADGDKSVQRLAKKLLEQRHAKQ